MQIFNKTFIHNIISSHLLMHTNITENRKNKDQWNTFYHIIANTQSSIYNNYDQFILRFYL